MSDLQMLVEMGFSAEKAYVLIKNWFLHLKCN